MTPPWLLEASLLSIWLPSFCIFGFLLHSWLTLLPIMLTDVLTYTFAQHMTHPPNAYSFMLIPCLVITYKAPIILLPIPYQSPLLFTNTILPPCIYSNSKRNCTLWNFEYLNNNTIFSKDVGVWNVARRVVEPRKNPLLNSTNLSLSEHLYQYLLYSLSLVGFSIQVYSSLPCFIYFPRFRWSLDSLSSLSHRFGC